MARDLSDPNYEPSDHELQELARDAFADVPEKIRAAQRRLREEIAELRARRRSSRP